MEKLPSAASSFISNCKNSQAEDEDEENDEGLEFQTSLFMKGFTSKGLVIKMDLSGVAVAPDVKTVLAFVRKQRPTLFHGSPNFGLQQHPGDEEPTAVQEFGKVCDNVHIMAVDSDFYCVIIHWRSDMRGKYMDVMARSNCTRLAGPVVPLYWFKDEFPVPSGLMVGANVEEGFIAFFGPGGKRHVGQFPRQEGIDRLAGLIFPTTPLFKRHLDTKALWRDQINPALLHQYLINFTKVQSQHDVAVVVMNRLLV